MIPDLDEVIKSNLSLLFSELEYVGVFSYFKYLQKLVALGITDSKYLNEKV